MIKARLGYNTRGIQNAINSIRKIKKDASQNKIKDKTRESNKQIKENQKEDINE